ncbi:MAG: hypothetical protein IT432_12230 [Phycisphaerales bacterium]|nr:hypothetical protein [Phycisphaerales bacterium]
MRAQTSSNERASRAERIVSALARSSELGECESLESVSDADALSSRRLIQPQSPACDLLPHATGPIHTPRAVNACRIPEHDMNDPSDAASQRRVETIKARFHAGDERGALQELTRMLHEHAARTQAAADQATAALRDLKALVEGSGNPEVGPAGD